MPRWRHLPVMVGLIFSLLSVFLWGLLGEERAQLEAEDVMVAVRGGTA